MEVILVVVLRLLAPITILRWPLFGGILCMVLDALDVVLIDILGNNGFPNYHTTDKLLDMTYLSIELYTSLKWANKLAKRASIVLFVYRAIGVVLFELLHIRVLLFIFQNVFENFYLLYLGYQKITKKDPITNMNRLALFVVLAAIPKIPQEYLLHFSQAKPWNWMKESLLAPLNIRL